MKTSVEKNTVAYAYFFVRTNQICVISITEVPAYPKTLPGTNYILIVCQVLLSVVLGQENSRDSPTVHVPRDMTPGIMSQEDKIRSNNSCLPGQRPRGKIHSIGKNTPTRKLHFTFLLFHHWWKCVPKTIFHHWTVSPYHHYTIYWFHHFTICAKDIYSSWHHLENEKTIALFHPKT